MNIEDVSKIINGVILKNTKKKVNKIKIDSRLVNKNDLFIALIGNNVDSHKYISDIDNKASIVVISKDDYLNNINCGVIKVEDTYEALVSLSKFYRNKYPIPLIAITGSVGKTTTKELISSMLEQKYNVLKTYKNYNNHIGLPLTLLELNNKKDIIVTEMGMNHRGEIHNLSLIAKPDLSIITNIGTSHIGNLGSKKNIFLSKMEIVDGMNKPLLYVNGYDHYLKKIKHFNVTKVKRKNKDFSIKNIKYNIDNTSFDIIYNNKTYSVVFNVPGVEMLNNLLISISVALKYKIDINDICKVINKYKSKDSRLEINDYNNITLINDCYNASFESTKMILNNIKKINKNKIIILGDMKELGIYSKKYHKKIIKILKKIKNKKVLLIGNEYKCVNKKYKHFNSNLELIEYLKNINLNDSTILIKGSRAMHLEEITEYIKSCIN